MCGSTAPTSALAPAGRPPTLSRPRAHPQRAHRGGGYVHRAGDHRGHQALHRERVDGKTLIEVFQEAGCKVGQPSCAACLGGPVDTFGRLNEPLKCISTTNRNFPGRMGHRDGQVFLASPLTAAASAVTGHITDHRSCSERSPMLAAACSTRHASVLEGERAAIGVLRS